MNSASPSAGHGGNSAEKTLYTKCIYHKIIFEKTKFLAAHLMTGSHRNQDGLPYCPECKSVFDADAALLEHFLTAHQLGKPSSCKPVLPETHEPDSNAASPDLMYPYTLVTLCGSPGGAPLKTIEPIEQFLSSKGVTATFEVRRIFRCGKPTGSYSVKINTANVSFGPNSTIGGRLVRVENLGEPCAFCSTLGHCYWDCKTVGISDWLSPIIKDCTQYCGPVGSLAGGHRNLEEQASFSGGVYDGHEENPLIMRPGKDNTHHQNPEEQASFSGGLYADHKAESASITSPVTTNDPARYLSASCDIPTDGIVPFIELGLDPNQGIMGEDGLSIAVWFQCQRRRHSQDDRTILYWFLVKEAGPGIDRITSIINYPVWAVSYIDNDSKLKAVETLGKINKELESKDPECCFIFYPLSPRTLENLPKIKPKKPTIPRAHKCFLVFKILYNKHNAIDLAEVSEHVWRFLVANNLPSNFQLRDLTIGSRTRACLLKVDKRVSFNNFKARNRCLEMKKEPVNKCLICSRSSHSGWKCDYGRSLSPPYSLGRIVDGPKTDGRRPDNGKDTNRNVDESIGIANYGGNTAMEVTLKDESTQCLVCVKIFEDGGDFARHLVEECEAHGILGLAHRGFAAEVIGKYKPLNPPGFSDIKVRTLAGYIETCQHDDVSFVLE